MSRVRQPAVTSTTPQVQALITCLQDRHHPAYFAAVNVLAQVGSEALPAVIQALSHENSDVRMGAALTLKQSHLLEALPALLSRWNDPDSDVCQVAKQALASLGGQAVVPLLRRIHSEAEAEREFVRDALRMMAYDGDLSSGLGAYLYEADAETKILMIELIGISGVAGSVPYLIDLARIGVRQEINPIHAALLDALSGIIADSVLPSLLEHLPVTPEVGAALDRLQLNISQAIAEWRDRNEVFDLHILQGQANDNHTDA